MRRKSMSTSSSKFPVRPEVALLFALLVVVSAVSTYTYISLARANTQLQMENNLLRQAYDDLKLKYTELNRQYRILLSDYDSLRAELNQTRSNFESCRAELNDYVSTVYSTFSLLDQWIALNTVASHDVVIKLFRNCVKGEDVFDYPCMLFEQNFGYRPDPEGEPQLYTYDYLLREGTGDCDDYSLFAMALVNRIAEDGYQVQFMRPSLGSVYPLPGGWYYEDEEMVQLNPLYAEMYCGDLPDGVGHCVIKVVALEGNYWVEPQTGEILESDPFDGNYYIIQTRSDLYFIDQWYSRAYEITLRELNLLRGWDGE